jgi:hypothetical protein
MKKLTLLIFFVGGILASHLYFFAFEKNKPHQAYGGNCSQRFGRYDECHTSIVSIAGFGPAYAGKKVNLVGFLSFENGVLALYPSRESFLFRDAMVSIELLGNIEQLKGPANRWSYSYVRVSGIFELGDSKHAQGPRLGILKETEIHSVVEESPQEEGDKTPALRVNTDMND